MHMTVCGKRIPVPSVYFKMRNSKPLTILGGTCTAICTCFWHLHQYPMTSFLFINTVSLPVCLCHQVLSSGESGEG